MTMDFVKFMVVVAILYIGSSNRNTSLLKAADNRKGFLTTFTLLARDNFSLAEMSWILIKVFFGSSYLGFVSRILNSIKSGANRK
jgi:hypothetical protein